MELRNSLLPRPILPARVAFRTVIAIVGDAVRPYPCHRDTRRNR